MMRLVGLALLAAGCVADVAGSQSSGERIGEGGDEGEGSGSGMGNESSISPAGYLEQIAEVQCEQAHSCREAYPGEPAAFETTWTASTPECTAKWFAAWNPSALESEIAKGRVEFDGTAAIACLGGVAFGTCSEYWTTGISWGEPCYHVMVGIVPAGGSCDHDYACTSGTCDLTTHRCL